MTENNKKIAEIFNQIAELLEIKGKSGGIKDAEVIYKPRAYRKAADFLMNLNEDIAIIYKEKGIRGIEDLPSIGKKLSQKIKEYLKSKKIKRLEELNRETAIQQIVTHYFGTKGLSLQWLKESAKKKKILYSRFAKPAE